MDYSVTIDKFEGPLDLLLHLVKISDIDIFDISIEEITKQYLKYITEMEKLNLNIASEYLVMAAELIPMPIISEGDIVGCVASVTDHPNEPHREIPGSEVETKLILTAAGFLGRQLES